MDENTIYVNQVLAIEHIGLSKYKITYLSENFTKDSVLPTVLPTKIIGSLYEIDDSQLELITLCWPGMKGNVGKLNFRNTLNSACEIIDSQLKPKPLTDRTIENTGHAININLATH